MYFFKRLNQTIRKMAVQHQVQSPFLDAFRAFERVPTDRDQEGCHKLALGLFSDGPEIVPEHNSSQGNPNCCQR